MGSEPVRRVVERSNDAFAQPLGIMIVCHRDPVPGRPPRYLGDQALTIGRPSSSAGLND